MSRTWNASPTARTAGLSGQRHEPRLAFRLTGRLDQRDQVADGRVRVQGVVVDEDA